MSNKFDEFEKERQEQEKEIKELRSEICFFNEKCNCIMENRRISKSNILDKIGF